MVSSGDFYKMFEEDLVTILYHLYQETEEQRVLPNSFDEPDSMGKGWMGKRRKEGGRRREDRERGEGEKIDRYSSGI